MDDSAAQQSPLEGFAPAVERALNVLETLADCGRGLTLSELSRRLGLPKSSTSLILATLERRGYIQKERHTRRYRCGPKLVGLSRVATEHLDLAEEAKPFLQSLMHKTGFCSHMAVLDGAEAVMIEKINAPGRNRVTTTWVGQRVPAHCTGIGKAMIAWLPEDEFQRQIGGRTLWKYNDKTITSVDRLVADLRKTRERGYSLSNEESQIGYRGIGAPILDSSGKVVAGISIDGNVGDLPLDLAPALGKIVRQTAATISAYLAHGVALPWEAAPAGSPQEN